MSIYARVIVTCTACDRCSETAAAEIERLRARVAELHRDLAITRDQLREALKLSDLQGADLDRWRELVATFQRNRPERVPQNELQLAFEQVIASMTSASPANAVASDSSESSATPNAEETPDPKDTPGSERGKGRGGSGGRRSLDMSNLPVKEIVVDPPEVLADGGEGWELIGVEVSECIAHERGGIRRVRTLRRKYKKSTTRTDVDHDSSESTPQLASANAPDVEESECEPATHIVTAPLPESLWPRTMGDPSLIANIIVSKYDDSLPLHRQETITERDGFRIPRSTQCDWLEQAFSYTWRITDAMMKEGLRTCSVIGTDATSAPVRAVGECATWHVFVFILEHDHVVFRHTPEHTGDAIRKMLPGYHGHLMSDAHSIYDVLYREERITEVADWAHGRRYFWKALPTDRARAMQGIALIGRLFEVERIAKDMSPDQRLRLRRERSAPLVDLYEEWVDRERDRVDERSPIHRALGYSINQRDALRRFLDDGRLPLHNNLSEAALRKLVLGRANWMFFENENGLKWYCTFRSLIASCALHGVNVRTYLEQVLRLAPHWPTTRMLELSPKYWKRTFDALDDRGRRIITPPWELEPATVPNRPRRAKVAA